MQRGISTFTASAGGWTSNEQYPRMLADVNGDGLADIVGFGEAGVFVTLATGFNFVPSAAFEAESLAPVEEEEAAMLYLPAHPDLPPIDRAHIY